MSSIFKCFSQSAPANADKQRPTTPTAMPDQLPPIPHRPAASTSNKSKARLPPPSSTPVIADFDSAHLTLGAGAAIFHLATARCVLCYHPVHHYYFLPKGRKDTHETLTDAAQREGFEESGYRNRLLPVPMGHRQPIPAHGIDDGGDNAHQDRDGKEEWATEAIWCQMMPVSRRAQYVLFWYVAETVPEDVERAMTEAEKAGGVGYRTPPAFEPGMTLRKRMGVDGKGYEPVRHEGTGVDEEEALYESSLVGIDEAIRKLGRGSVSADVVRRGWEAVRKRWVLEGNGKAG